MSKSKTVYFCTECGNETPRWQGKCPACGAWNTLTEHIERGTRGKSAPVGMSKNARLITDIDTETEIRFSTGLSELDRVLGGGAVLGSLVSHYPRLMGGVSKRSAPFSWYTSSISVTSSGFSAPVRYRVSRP